MVFDVSVYSVSTSILSASLLFLILIKFYWSLIHAHFLKENSEILNVGTSIQFRPYQCRRAKK